MIEWWRSWHGAPTDGKWLVVAKRAGVAPVIVSAIAWALFDHASQADDRGSVDGFDVEVYATWAGIDESQVQAVLDAMTAKGIITDGRLSAWEKRQPKREDDSTERVRAFRERQRVTGDSETRVNYDVTQRNADETNGNAPEKIKSREEKINTPRARTRALEASSPEPDEPTPNGAARQPIPQRVVYGAFTEHLGRTPATKTEKGKWEGGVKELVEAGITAEQVPRLIARYRKRFPAVECNPKAIASNLSTLDRDDTTPAHYYPTADELRAKYEQDVAVYPTADDLRQSYRNGTTPGETA